MDISTLCLPVSGGIINRRMVAEARALKIYIKIVLIPDHHL